MTARLRSHLPALPQHRSEAQRWLRYVGRFVGTLEAVGLSLIVIQQFVVLVLVLLWEVFGIASGIESENLTGMRLAETIVVFAGFSFVVAGCVIGWWRDGLAVVLIGLGTALYLLIVGTEGLSYTLPQGIVSLMFFGAWWVGRYADNRRHGTPV